MQAPSIVGLPAGLSVGTVYDNQQGKIIVPNDISHLQEPSMASYPPPIIVPDVVPVSDPKMDGDGTKRKKKVFVCTYEGCGKCFESQWGLTRHIRIHTGEKPFKCTVPGCGKSFSEKCALNRHMIAHDSSKPYKCTHPGCEKSFKSREYLESHRRLHEETDPFKCTINNCNRVFSSVKSLRHHQVTWHNSKGTESATEQLLRERILKLQQKYKTRLDKMEKHLRDVIENNRQLKKENADYRREHLIPVPKTSKQKKGFDQEELHTRPETTLPTVISEKPELPPGLFNASISVPVEIDTIMGNSHVSPPGNLIILPPMQNLPSLNPSTSSLQLDQDMDHSTQTSIML